MTYATMLIASLIIAFTLGAPAQSPALPATFNVSGQALLKGKPPGVEGVEIVFERVSPKGSAPGSARADANGQWRQSGFQSCSSSSREGRRRPSAPISNTPVPGVCAGVGRLFVPAILCLSRATCCPKPRRRSKSAERSSDTRSSAASTSFCRLAGDMSCKDLIRRDCRETSPGNIWHCFAWRLQMTAKIFPTSPPLARARAWRKEARQPDSRCPCCDLEWRQPLECRRLEPLW